MKTLIKHYIVFMSIFLLSVNTQAQWVKITNTFDNNALPWITALTFSDENIGYASCMGLYFFQSNANEPETGSIIRTTNGGLDWETVLSIDSIRFNDIVQPNDSTIFSVGCDILTSKGIISRSTNYGYNWDNTMLNEALFSTSFSSTNIGYASGTDGSLYKTTDGGENWVDIYTPFTNSIRNVLFLNDTVGFIATDTVISKTSDGGQTWTCQNIVPTNGTTSFINAIDFPSYNTGYLILSLDSTLIYKTINNGDDWFLHSTPFARGLYATDIHFTSDSIGYFCGQFQVQKSTDGGLTWQRQREYPFESDGFFDDLTSIYFVNQDTGFVGGASQLYKTFHGGDTIIDDINIRHEGISIFPVPFNNCTTIETNKFFFNAVLILYNSSGNIVRHDRNITGKQYLLLRSNLPFGLYYYNIQDDDESYYGKLIISDY